MKALISIIVPVYNVEDYLDRCLNSVIYQTYKNLEIILVDDGSPDTCPQKCDEWAAKDSRIVVIHKENGGLGFARNSGLDIASGDYVLFLDSDDYIPLDTVENMVKRIENDRSDLVVGTKVFEYPDGTQGPPRQFWDRDSIITREEALHMLVSSTCAFPTSAWGKLYKRSLFDGLRFSSLKTDEDTHIAPFVIDRCETISLMTGVVYYYYQRENSIVHTLNEAKQLDRIRALLLVSRFLFDRHYIREAAHYYNYAICCVVKMKGSGEAQIILNSSFDQNERKILKKAKSKVMRKALLAAKFPKIYGLLKSKRTK